VTLSSSSTVQSPLNITAGSLYCSVLEQCHVNKHIQRFLILQLDGRERAAEGRLDTWFVFAYTAVIGCWQLLTSRDDDKSPRAVILLFPSAFFLITSDMLSGEPLSRLCHGSRPRFVQLDRRAKFRNYRNSRVTRGPPAVRIWRILGWTEVITQILFIAVFV
jgi:hypothetical protein